MGEAGKGVAYGADGAEKRPETPVKASPEEPDHEKMEEEEEIIKALLCVGDEMTGELTKLLEEETAAPPRTAAVSLYSPPLISLSSSSVTINHNEETCGSSFSDSDASVMASVDTCGVAPFLSYLLDLPAADPSGGAWSSDDDKAARGEASLDGSGCDHCSDCGARCDWDNEMVARFFGEGDDDGAAGLMSSIWAED